MSLPKKDKKLTIVVSANTSWYVWNFRLTLIREIRSLGHTVIVVAPRDSYSGRFASEGIEYHDVYIRAKGKNPLHEILTFFSYVNIYYKTRSNIALQYTIKPNLYGSLAARLLNITVINNVSGLGAAFNSKGPTLYLITRMYKLAFKKAYRVFFQNANDASEFTELCLVDEKKTSLLPGSGVNLSCFTPRPKSGGVFTFLFIGRLLREKGVEDFIRAATLVRMKLDKPVAFHLVGNHDPSDSHMADKALIDEAVNKGIISVQGQVDSIIDWISTSDCVVLPSYYREGIPRSLLEAAACAKPLIAADSIGTREPVIDGLNGFLCKPRDPSDLADCMLKMISLSESDRHTMGKESRKIAEKRFDERIVINAYLDLIQRFDDNGDL